MKETDPWICNINAVGCGHIADKVWRRGQKGIRADTRRTCADKVWRLGQRGPKADTQRKWRHGQSGLKATKAETRRTQGGHKADTWRTHGGQAPGTRPEHIAASSFFPKREPHYTSIDPKQFFKQRVPLQRPTLVNI